MNWTYEVKCPKCKVRMVGDSLLPFCPGCFIELNKFEFEVEIMLENFPIAAGALTVYPVAMAKTDPSAAHWDDE